MKEKQDYPKKRNWNYLRNTKDEELLTEIAQGTIESIQKNTKNS